MSLKNTNILPPAGWVYSQKDNAGKVVKQFKSMSPFPDACKEILQCRVANGFNRATLPQVMEDVDEAQCARLGYDPAHVKKKPVSFTPTRLFSPLHLREDSLMARALYLDGSEPDCNPLMLELPNGELMCVPADFQELLVPSISRASALSPLPPTGFVKWSKRKTISSSKSKAKRNLKRVRYVSAT